MVTQRHCQRQQSSSLQSATLRTVMRAAQVIQQVLCRQLLQAVSLLACIVGGVGGVVLALTVLLYVVRRRRNRKYPEQLASPEPSQSTQRKSDLVKHSSLGSETSSHTSRSPLTQSRRNVRVGSTATYHLQNGYLERDSPLEGHSPYRWQTNGAGTGYPLNHSNSAWHGHASSFRRHVVGVSVLNHYLTIVGAQSGQ